jgi:hypothetical protein
MSLSSLNFSIYLLPLHFHNGRAYHILFYFFKIQIIRGLKYAYLVQDQTLSEVL